MEGRIGGVEIEGLEARGGGNDFGNCFILTRTVIV